jgi:hypothetical protein
MKTLPGADCDAEDRPFAAALAHEEEVEALLAPPDLSDH